MHGFGPIVGSSGPLTANILILGDMPGDRESERGKPFVGPAGWELRKMLEVVGINLDDTYRCNVFSRQPPSNNLAYYCTEDVSDQARELGPIITSPSQQWLDKRFTHELDRLHSEIASVGPNLILALGNTATWALGLGTGLSSLRGTIHPCKIADRTFKCLPTFHPSLILRQYSNRSIAISDLSKAAHEQHFPEIQYDNTELWLNPTLEDLEEFDLLHMAPSSICACDIETRRGQVTCLSFAPNPHYSLAIPFWVEAEGPNYWRTSAEELEAWLWAKRWLERADLIKVFQNGLFDLSYLANPPYSFRPLNCTADTMLMSHSLWSELPKGLGFLGSVFTNFQSWKGMRHFSQDDQIKRDE